MSLSFKKKLSLTLLVVVSFSGVFAQDNFVAKSIEVEGLERISKETVLNNLGIHPCKNLNTIDTNEAITLLYNSGFFKNVKLYQDGGTLIIKVSERPAISSVVFDGNNKIHNDDMNKVLLEVGLNVGSIVKPETLFQVKQSLLQQYALMGYYSTTVDVQKVKEDRNRVAIKINIAEGKKATVRRINIIGNQAFLERELINNITFKTPSIFNLWGLFTSEVVYTPQNMHSSVEDLINYYMNHGYLDFQVISQQASLSAPNKENAFIAFDVSEGEIYKVSNVTLEGNFIVLKADLEKCISFEVGDIFSRQKVLDSAKAIKALLGDKGYAFANINPVPKVYKDNKTVVLTFHIDPGKKVYVNKINFLGNNITNDYVYRRQMQYFESGVYNQSMIDQSIIKLQRMPFVESVSVNQVAISGSDDFMDIDYNIKERSANTVSASIGYSQLYNFMIGGNLILPNIQGTGNRFSIDANLSSICQSLNMSYTDQYFKQLGVSQMISTYLSRTDYDDTSITSYRLNQYGANLEYSIPTSLFDSVRFGGGVDYAQLLQPVGGNSAILKWFLGQNRGQSSFNTFTINLGWDHNSTDRAFFPREGATLGLNGRVSIPGISDLQWYKVRGLAGFFHPVIGDATFSVKSSVEYGNGYGKTKCLPFFQNFYGGGWGSVRGFAQGGMGPSDIYTPTGESAQQGNSIGGNLNIYTNIDLLFPIPGLKDSRNMRLGIFFDLGNLYNTYNIPIHSNSERLCDSRASINLPTFSNLRYSVGVEFQWLSPLGAMAFSLTKPLNTKPSDSTQIFQFTLGQTF